MPTIGINLRVTTDCKQGGRKYMEDVISVKFEKGRDGKEIEFAYFAVYDGHGGAEASSFAKQHLLNEITKQKGFWCDDDAQIMKAMKEAFLNTHRMMWRVVGTWPKTTSGMPSTSGSTASVVIIRNGKMYVAHVGDSTVVLGSRENSTDDIVATAITEDHKPESPEELKRIEANGGRVMCKSGVQRVVWYRPKISHKGPVRRSTEIDHIPFLAVARSLGDLWSYNSEQDAFVVSPEPDMACYKLDPAKHKCVILASDGLWNMVKPQEAVDLVTDLETENEERASDSSAVPRKPAGALVRLALDRWAWHCVRADNTSVIVVIFDPPGQSRSHLRQHYQHVLTGGPTTANSDGEDSTDSTETDPESSPVSDAASDCELEKEAAVSPSNSSSPFMVSPFTPLNDPPHSLSSLSHTSNQKLFWKNPPKLPGFNSGIFQNAPSTAPSKLANRNFKSWPLATKRRLGTVYQLNCKDGKRANSPVFGSKIGGRSSFYELASGASLMASPVLRSSKSDSVMQGMTSGSSIAALDLVSGQRLRSADPSPLLSVFDSPGACLPRLQQGKKYLGNNSSSNTEQSVHTTTSSGTKLFTSITSCTALASPKEATSAKSPLKIDVNQHGCPSADVVSPIWPNSLGLALEIELSADALKGGISSDISLQDSCENIENPCFSLNRTPGKSQGVKRKSSPASCLLGAGSAKRVVKSPSPRKSLPIDVMHQGGSAHRTRCRSRNNSGKKH